ncbi:hypothetical protein BDY17DRAFT_311112 [Neohortaea acidophila]|uniref:Uncharacterized protein n=1 Tax=Neohortaea acidophila TaxID=245834 RepID=A0A6A6PRG9_9PEZI|nr:uncharacterized protein BDY17DRAFT_311112 [Neohortaea acidophila]KAF2482679.1 hypothetical protein BDY17DRAFT_311112 [Neohortaea acidophila]
MSWSEPWLFLDRLRRWLALLSRALLPSTSPKDESAIEVLQEHRIRLVVALQHTDQQEMLLRESYTEQTFDYVSQCLRTCLLPLSAALVYVPTNMPPQPLGGALSEAQKVLYTSLDLNVAALQSKVGKLENAPKHNVVDRMAIVVPSGWDSVGKIRLLSENFSPEAVLEGWTTDLAIPIFPSEEEHETDDAPDDAAEADSNEHDLHANGGAEVYESGPRPPSLVSSPPPSPPMSPSKLPKSALADYERRVQDPNAHKAPPPPEIEVTMQPTQEFLADMRAQLVQYEAQDAEKGSFASTNAGALNTSKFNLNIAGANATGEALDNLGDVSFNVGGVSYNTLTAGEAIERLKRPQLASPRSDSKSGTPRSARRDQSGTQDGDFPTEKLEEYFASLIKKGGGSRGSTPSKS